MVQASSQIYVKILFKSQDAWTGCLFRYSKHITEASGDKTHLGNSVLLRYAIPERATCFSEVLLFSYL